MNFFVDKLDKYFVYFGWLSDFIEVCVTGYILYQFIVIKPDTCCHDSNIDPKCSLTSDDGTLSEYSDNIIIDPFGWCIVDNIPCIPTDIQCYNGTNAQELCDTKKQNSTGNIWNYIVVGILLIKIVKIGLDYYITIMEFREKKRTARINMNKLLECNTDEEKDNIQYEEEQPVTICFCIKTNSDKFAQGLFYLWFIGIILSFYILYSIDNNAGLTVIDCDTATIEINGESVSKNCDAYKNTCTLGEGIYVINNNEIDLEGPAIIATIASIIGYILYVPWIREKVNNYMYQKGWIAEETNEDKQADVEQWMGLL